MERHTLRHYMHDIAHCPRLTQAETAALAERSRAGDREARNAMVEGNLPLVITAAKRFRNRGLEWDELVAAGNMGLIRAAELYNPAEAMFSTYATRWIRSTISRELDQNLLIHVPIHVLYPTESTIPRYADHAQRARALKLDCDYHTRHHAKDQATPLDRHPDPRNQDTYTDWRLTLDRGLRKLPARDQTILRLVFGVDQPSGLRMSTTEVGQEVGLTRNGTRYAKINALAALREQVPQLEDQLV